jgi:N-methylhydantoinase A/oxoprolinase/acetone carboxylase beta subunit
MQRGPMIVEEPDTTVVVPPGWSISSDGYANLTLAKL